MTEKATDTTKNEEKSEDKKTRSYSIIKQGVSDLSFENPYFFQNSIENPEFSFEVDIKVANSDDDENIKSVSLLLKSSAKDDNGKDVCLVELTYSALVEITNCSEADALPLLLVETPHQIYPFARAFYANCVREGGHIFPSLPLINFAGLYKQKMAEQQQNLANNEKKN